MGCQSVYEWLVSFFTDGDKKEKGGGEENEEEGRGEEVGLTRKAKIKSCAQVETLGRGRLGPESAVVVGEVHGGHVVFVFLDVFCC